jgi:hypothetical protein
LPATTVERAATSFLRDIGEGGATLLRSPWLLAITIEGMLYATVVIPAIYILGPLIAERSYDGARTWGFLLSALAIGAVFGGAAAGFLRIPRPTLALVLTGFLAVPALVTLSATPAVPLIAVGMMIMGFSFSFYDSLLDALVQSRFPAVLHGRLASWDEAVSTVLTPIGFIAIGPVQGVFGTQTTLLGATVLVVSSTLVDRHPAGDPAGGRAGDAVRLTRSAERVSHACHSRCSTSHLIANRSMCRSRRVLRRDREDPDPDAASRIAASGQEELVVLARHQNAPGKLDAIDALRPVVLRQHRRTVHRQRERLLTRPRSGRIGTAIGDLHRVPEPRLDRKRRRNQSVAIGPYRHAPGEHQPMVRRPMVRRRRGCRRGRCRQGKNPERREDPRWLQDSLAAAACGCCRLSRREPADEPHGEHDFPRSVGCSTPKDTGKASTIPGDPEAERARGHVAALLGGRMR